MNILVTGGAGFIGSHTLIELCEAGHCPVVVDNLSNSSPKAIERVEKITGKTIPFYNVDIRDREGLEKVFAQHTFDCCIHFAGLKAVGESVQKPWEYYENNIGGTLVLVDVMRRHGCKNIIFSSSATVYGAPETMPITEDCPKGTVTNPYGQTKSMLEQVLTDIQKADPEWNVVLLRYFNPTGVRDYIHVVDLAKGHVCALKAIENKCGLGIYNLGTGQGYSVLDLVHAFEKATGVKVPYVIKPRRSGDVAECWSDPSKAARELGWKAQYGVEDMCADAWRWQKNNPNGYRD